ncbi:MAG: response regulator transcription factor [Cyanobacteria bacterium J06641_5]
MMSVVAPVEVSACVLLVEADKTFAQRLKLDLQEAGYASVVAIDTQEGWQQFQQLQPTLVVVDRARAGARGLEFCQQVRALGLRTPILLLMARDSVEDRIACIECGADDYLARPYRPERFLELVRLYLRPSERTTEQLQFANLSLDLSVRRATRGGRTIELTMKEFDLLKLFMTHPCEVLSRDRILEAVWGYDYMGESNVIEVYIRYLRLKIEGDNERRLIQTVRGVGYVLREA